MRRTGFAILWLTVAFIGPAARSARGQEGPPHIHQRPQYGLSAGLLFLSWADDRVSSAVGPTLQVTRRVLGPVRAEVGLATLTAEVRPESADARLYQPWVGVAVGPSFRVSDRIELIPRAGVSIGTTVTDPKPDSLATRSQNSWGFTVGTELVLRERWMLALDYSRRVVRLQSLAQGIPGPGDPTVSHAVEVRVGVRF